MNPPGEFSGGCACGAIRYVCSAPPVAMLSCHCRDCQRAGGGASSPTVVVASESFALKRGQPKVYCVPAESGETARRAFCADCGSPLWASSGAREGALGLRAASLDDPSWFRPSVHVWTASAQPWDCMEPEVPRFAKSRPRGGGVPNGAKAGA